MYEDWKLSIIFRYSTIYPEKSSVLSLHFTITTANFSPICWAVYNQTSETFNTGGYAFDLLDAVAQTYNFTYDVKYSVDKEYGILLPTGRWTG